MARNDILVRIGLKGLSNFRKDLKKASHNLRRAGQNMKRNGEELSKAVTLPIVGVGAAAVMTAAKFEKLQVSLNTLTGSAKEGARAFERLKELSAGTPFQLEQLVKAQNTLMGFGLSSDEAFDSVKRLGDIAAITGADMGNLAIAFGQSAAEGRVMSKDIRQFINNGVPMIKLLAEEMGVAESSIFDLASEGKITFEVLQRAFRRSTEEGGMFADGMKKQSTTIAGLFSTLKDNVSILLADIGKAIVDAGLREMILKVTDAVRVLVKAFAQLSPETKQAIIIVAALAAAIGPLLMVLGQMKIAVAALGFNFAALLSPITLVIGAVGALVAAFIYARDNWGAIVERLSDWGWWRNTLIEMAKFVIKWNPMALMLKPLELLMDYLGIDIPNAFDDVANALDGLKVETKEYETEFGTFGRAVKNAAKDAAGALGLLASKQKDVTEELEKAPSPSMKPLPPIKKSAEEALSEISKMFNSAPVKLIDEFILGWNKGRATLTETIVSPFRNAFDLPTSIGITEIFKKTRDNIKAYFDSGAFDFINKNILGFTDIKPMDDGQGGEGEEPEWLKQIRKYAGMAQDILGGLFDFWGQAQENREAKAQQNYERELERIESSAMSEKAKEQAISKLNAKRDKEERKLAREKAKRDKAIALFNAIVNGAAQVAKVAANPVLAAIVAGIAAANIAAIAAEPLPALAEGGLAYGPTTALVGDNVNARVNPEVIAPLDKLKSMMGEGGNIRLSGNFRIDGQDLIYVIEENQQIRERR